jgi:hypothetical protein
MPHGQDDQNSFSGIMEQATDLLEIIHTDMCGPMSILMHGGYRYFSHFY